jgi:Glycosyltransferase family 87
MTPTARRALFGAALGLCWLSAGAEPLIRTAVLVTQPNDFTPDFVAAHAWLHGGPHGPAFAAVMDGPAGNAYASTLGAPAVTLLSAYYVHPPTALLLMMPLCPLGYQGAAVAWLALSVLLVGALAALLLALAKPPGPFPRSTLALFPLLLLWPPVLSNFQNGQWSILLAALIAAGWAAWERGRHQRGAAWFGAAVALKLTPIVLLPFVVLRNRRATVAFAGTLAAVAGLSLALGQLDAWRSLFRHSAENVAAWQSYQHNTLSLGGLTARLLTGGEFARPLLVAPALARALGLGAGAALAGVAFWLTIAPGSPPDRLREGCRFALWNILAVVTNPLAWPHYAILLLLPLTLVLRSVDRLERRAPVVRGLLGAALLLLTIPPETIDRLAGSAPVAPWRGLFASSHLAGALLLFAAAALGARSAREPLPAGPEAPPAAG